MHCSIIQVHFRISHVFKNTDLSLKQKQLYLKINYFCCEKFLHSLSFECLLNLV